MKYGMAGGNGREGEHKDKHSGDKCNEVTDKRCVNCERRLALVQSVQ